MAAPDSNTSASAGRPRTSSAGRPARCSWCASRNTNLSAIKALANRAWLLAMTLNEVVLEPGRARSLRLCGPETAFGCPRDFLDNRFVYVVISPRARGLSVGVNVNADKRCNFDCIYCEVHRNEAPREAHLDVEVMAQELRKTLAFVLAGRLNER